VFEEALRLPLVGPANDFRQGPCGEGILAAGNRWIGVEFTPAKPSQKLGANMSGNSDKAACVANEAIGKTRQGIGKAVGSDKMKAKGAAQELKGDVQKATGDAKNAAKKAVDKTAAALKRPL
jgi:uncharacterized protein YjbJ (UPF0337 family)